jgi:hypothetical protein
MKRLTATICLTIAVLLGSAGVSLGQSNSVADLAYKFRWYADVSVCHESIFGKDKELTKEASRRGLTVERCRELVGQGRSGQSSQAPRSGKDPYKIVTALPPCPSDQNQIYQQRRFYNCFGTYTYGGNKYVGEFGSGKFHGQGTHTSANGNKYVGEFRDDKFHGQGTYTYADGRIEEGIWNDGKFQYAQKVPMQSVKPSLGNSTNGIESRLTTLKSLHSKGLISDSEYKTTKAKVLKGF